MSKPVKVVALHIVGFEDRKNISLALLNNGYKVWVDNIKRDYGQPEECDICIELKEGDSVSATIERGEIIRSEELL